jgi:hypothetical protein
MADIILLSKSLAAQRSIHRRNLGILGGLRRGGSIASRPLAAGKQFSRMLPSLWYEPGLPASLNSGFNGRVIPV